MFKHLPFFTFLALCSVATACAADEPRLVIEDLGVPVRRQNLDLRCLTRDAAGRFMAWGAHESADSFALVGVKIESGETAWLETTQFGTRHIQMMSAPNGHLYAFTGVPGRFLKYDTAKGELIDLGVPAAKGTYWAGSVAGPDGKFYIGTYPDTELVRCDPATDRIENLGRLSSDPREKYIIHPMASDENVIYCPVGQYHGEVWAFDATTGEKRQILPEELMKPQGAPTLWTGTDGQVYGRIGETLFLCRRDGIEPGKTAKVRYRPEQLDADGWRVGDIDAEGRLSMTERNTKETVLRQTNYPGAPRTIFSVSCERDGVIYGGTVSPAHSFSYDSGSGKLTDLGQLASGPIQIYDTLDHPKGLFISSYMNASVDFFDPASLRKKGENPRRIVTLAGHERPMQLIEGPDGMLYAGTVPSKGRLGGALLRVDPRDFSHRVWENIIPNQSVLRLVALPESGEVLGVTSVSGGSSAIPTEKEACLFVWDCRKEEVVFRTAPLAGAKSYGAVVRAGNGIVYGVSSNRYYAFDPKRRELVFTGKLPVKSVRFPELNDAPTGRRGLIYGMGDDAIFAIDPADHSARIVARDPVLAKAYGFYMTQEGVLYFGAQSHLMRCRVGQPRE
jgi:outer membrane protein assembly factor BamB